jgi:ATP-dependent helicase/nuclease subunit A
MTALAAAPSSRPGVRLTADQRAAVDDRSGSALLAANAGSGKTAVMVERFVEAVLTDGHAVGSILALTFTEKAAGELRERVRRRFVALGEHERARETDAAWIGTIHGFCARVLRARPLAAGLDPRFTVLDEAAARRLAEAAYERALEAWAAARGAPAVDLAAAYGPALRELLLAAHETLRSRGESHPRLPIPPIPPPPDARVLAAAREAAAGVLATGDGKKVAAGRAALDACAAILAEEGRPWPGELDPAKLPTGAKLLDEPACEDYRAAFDAYRGACADRHARAALVLLDDLLDRFCTAFDEAKAARAGVDFADLELRVRDLLAAPAARAAWAERYALIMVDEFQDTNRLQLDVLEALERDNLFAVGDEFQSIYRFRHADVSIFRERRERRGAGRVRRLAHNFRSGEELLDVLNGAFAPELGERFAPLVAGAPAPPADADGTLRLFDPDPAGGDPPVELLVTDQRGWNEPELERALGLVALAPQPWRRAEARLVAHRLRAEIDAGRRPGDVVVLVRATASLRLLEQALEEQGLPTYVVGGRGYWSQEQVRDGVAYLAALANPQDEQALLGVLASPFCGAGTDALVLLAEAGRERDGLWPVLRDAETTPWIEHLPAAERERLTGFVRVFAAEREHAERTPVEVLLERAIVATGYDLAVLARSGGERRLANLRKLMRLARDYERAEGRDLRGFIEYAATQNLIEAREGEAALESEGLDAVRLMTIHRAKGLEFPVVCVADLGRAAGGARERLLIGRDGGVGLRLAPIGGGEPVAALGWQRLADAEQAEEAEEERRLFYVAMTRACERLILSGGVDGERWPAPRPGGPPIDWIARALTGDPAVVFAAAAADRVLEGRWEDRPVRLRCAFNAPATLDLVLPRAALSPAGRSRAGAPATALPDAPKVLPAPAARPRPAPQRLSFSSLARYARCGYRFYLERRLGMPRVDPPPRPDAEAAEPGLDAMTRGWLVHRALEALDFARPAPPPPEDVRALAEAAGVELTDADVTDIRDLVAAFAASPLCARLAAARRIRREASFVFGMEPGGGGPLVAGILDAVAVEPDGGVLIVDYKSHRLEGAEPADIVELEYSTQRIVYALAALRDGAPRAEVAYCFLERPGEPVTMAFTAADAGALAEQLAGLARGVIEGEYPVAAVPHRELCGDCPGRASMCSWDEDMTLRAQASAGSFGGSTGPS